MKQLFTISATQVKHAATLLEGLDRYNLLLEDIANITDEVGLPIIRLSNGKELRIHVPKEEFVALIDRNIQSIRDELDSLGIDYE